MVNAKQLTDVMTQYYFDSFSCFCFFFYHYHYFVKQISAAEIVYYQLSAATERQLAVQHSRNEHMCFDIMLYSNHHIRA